MKKILLIFALTATITGNSQWTSDVEVDPFEGNRTTVFGKGYGGEWPYSNPYLVIRKTGDKIDAYISNAGSLVCEEGVVRFSFGDPNNVLVFDMNPSVGDDAGFINTSGSGFIKLIDGLKKKNIVYVDFRTRCSQNRFKISLNGSSKELNRIFGAEWTAKANEADKRKREEQENLKKLNNNIAKFKIENAELVFKIDQVMDKEEFENIIRHAAIINSKIGVDDIKFKRHKFDVSFQYPQIIGVDGSIKELPLVKVNDRFANIFNVNYYENVTYDANSISYWGLDGRNVGRSGGIRISDPEHKSGDRVIVVNIRVNKAGGVVDAEINPDHTNVEKDSFLKEAIKLSKRYTFNADLRAPKYQNGWVKFKVY